MERFSMIERVWKKYLTANIENGEYSYVQAFWSKEILEKKVWKVSHYKLDLRFEDNEIAVLIETKTKFVDSDREQLAEYLLEEKILNPNKKIIAILANTSNDKINVWMDEISDKNFLPEETVLDSMDHYRKLFNVKKQNDKEAVMKNTYKLNEILHKVDIDEKTRSQFIGTALLYLKDLVNKEHTQYITEFLVNKFNDYWRAIWTNWIIQSIRETLNQLLDGSENKEIKIKLLQKNILEDQKVKKLSIDSRINVLDFILMEIYKNINDDSSEWQDILNLFFIAFNKYTGKADKNQAFTPDHITDFMARLTEVDRTKVVLDATCGSGSFLVQAMVKELADCRRRTTENEAKELMKIVKQKHIFWIEVEEKAYWLSTTNMLIHGDWNSNIKFASCFDCKDFIQKACPDVILMNPPYNAKPITIPKEYKTNWKKDKDWNDKKEDPTKWLVFIRYLSDVIKDLNQKNEKEWKPHKLVKLAVLLPVSAAIWTDNSMVEEKKKMLEENTLEAVFTLPDEVFYPWASVTACCMLFTLWKPHSKDKETFFWYYKEDWFKKKKNLWRVEQFDSEDNSIWIKIRDNWLSCFKNHKIIDWLSATAIVNWDDEWLCEAYMKTDYSKLTEYDFLRVRNNYLSYLAWAWKWSYFYKYTSDCWKKQMNFNVNQRKEFMIEKLFDVQLSKWDIKLDEVDEWNIPLISSWETTNWVVWYITEKWDWKAKIFGGNRITLDMFCNVFYQHEDFYSVSHWRVNILNPKFRLNNFIWLFISTIINKEQFKWSYWRAVYSDESKNMIIKLPIVRDINWSPIIDKNKEFSDEWYIPDREFMENYIKNLPYWDRI